MTRVLYILIYMLLASAWGCTQQKEASVTPGTEDFVAEDDTGTYIPPEPFALLEMFTSEGCVNCPAAYPVVQKMIRNFKSQGKNVYLLDYHVDYWNRNGWEDPYSKEAFTGRQRKYATVFRGAGLYTPQMVVNGSTEFVASDEIKEDRAIRQALSHLPSCHIALKVGEYKAKDSIPLHYTLSPVPEGSVVLVALVEHQVSSDVKAGENAGRTLVHYNVVREITSRPVIDKGGQIMVPPPQDNNGSYAIIAFVQRPDDMQVIGANAVEVSKNP